MPLFPGFVIGPYTGYSDHLDYIGIAEGVGGINTLYYDPIKKNLTFEKNGWKLNVLNDYSTDGGINDTANLLVGYVMDLWLAQVAAKKIDGGYAPEFSGSGTLVAKNLVFGVA